MCAVIMMLRDCAPAGLKYHIYGFNWPGGQWPAHKVQHPSHAKIFSCTTLTSRRRVYDQAELARKLQPINKQQNDIGNETRVLSQDQHQLMQINLVMWRQGTLMTLQSKLSLQVEEEHEEIEALEAEGSLVIHKTLCKVRLIKSCHECLLPIDKQ